MTDLPITLSAAQAEITRLRDELSARQVAVTVKPLEWQSGGFEQDADLIDKTETYQIQEGIFWYAAQVHGTECGDNEAAKAAAQADYKRRILSAITARPASEVWDAALDAILRVTSGLDTIDCASLEAAIRAMKGPVMSDANDTCIGPDGIARSFDEHYDTIMDVEQDATGAHDAIHSQAATIAALQAENERLREALERIDTASNHYAMTTTYSEGVLRYAHQSTRNLARAALAGEGEG